MRLASRKTENRSAVVLVTTCLLALLQTTGQADDDRYPTRSDSDPDRFERDIAFYTEAIRTDPMNPGLYRARGKAGYLARHYDRAILDFGVAIQLRPTDGPSYAARALCWCEKGDFGKAVDDCNEAVRVGPQTSRMLFGRAWVWLRMARFDQALADLTEAIRLEPTLGPAYELRGYAWARKGGFAKSVADYEEAARLDPSNLAACNSAAWMRATCPVDSVRNGKKAVELAVRACVLTGWKEGSRLDTLAAAYAELGEFDGAVKWQEAAISGYQDPIARARACERLALYRSRRPFRNEPKSKVRDDLLAMRIGWLYSTRIGLVARHPVGGVLRP